MPWTYKRYGRTNRRYTARPKARKSTAAPVFYKRRPNYSKFVRGGFPDVQLAKLRYCAEKNINAGSGLIGSHNFACNDLVDPDVTGVGHQPMGFDQMKAVYSNWQVVGSKITVRYAPTGTSNVNSAYGCVIVSDTGTEAAGLADASELLEMEHRGKIAMFGGYFSSNVKGGGPPVVSATWSLKKWLGQKKGASYEDEFAGHDNTGPTTIPKYEVVMATVGSNDPGDITFNVTIDYLVRFSSPKDPGQS